MGIDTQERKVENNKCQGEIKCEKVWDRKDNIERRNNKILKLAHR